MAPFENKASPFYGFYIQLLGGVIAHEINKKKKKMRERERERHTDVWSRPAVMVARSGGDNGGDGDNGDNGGESGGDIGGNGG